MLKKAEPPKSEREKRLREAIALHEIEGNALTPDQIAMFEMFDREGWTDEDALAHILQRHRQPD